MAKDGFQLKKYEGNFKGGLSKTVFAAKNLGKKVGAKRR